MKIWIESHIRQRAGEGLAPWMNRTVPRMQIETRHRDTPFPPLVCTEMWMRKWELKMKRHPPTIHSSFMYPSPLLLLLLSDWSPVLMWFYDSNTHATYTCPLHYRSLTHITCTHFFFPSHICTLLALPPVTYIACLDTFTITHTERSRGGGKTPDCCRSVNEQLQSVEENYPRWYLGTKAGTLEDGVIVVSASLTFIELFSLK